MGEGRYVPALDGIRALAVMSVMLFHFGVGWIAGGLLGVDVFFVLSGFLITALLLQERAATGTLSFGRFYARRARRLLPGLLMMILMVAVYAAWFAVPDQLPSIRSDVLSTIGYFANWHFIFSHQNYFQSGLTSPVLHTWSLAVEEQFYLLWPGVTWLVYRRYGRRGMAVAAGVGIVGSFVDTLVLSFASVSNNRLYYGTDTRVQELMTGALLAIIGPPVFRRLTTRPAVHRSAARGGTVLAWACLGGLLWMFHSVDGQSSFLYRGGFLLVSVVTACLVAAAVFGPASAIARLLALGPIRYVGRISYGLYLYHYPLFLLIDAGRTGLTGVPLLVVRLAATFAISIASFHLVELPVRSGGWRRVRVSPRALLLAVPTGLVVAVAAIVLATTLPSSSLNAPSVAASRFPIPASPPAGLTGDHQVRILLVGDSMALTLGIGLREDASAWGADVINRGAIGCDLDWNQTVNFQDMTTIAATGCRNWPEIFPGYVQQFQPDVVAILLGRFEYQNRLINGHWYTVGQAPWDDLITSLLEKAMKELSAGGAKIALLTLPYVLGTTTAPNGQPWDVNQPSRTNAWNADVRRAAAAFPGVATVVDLNKMVDPDGRYTSYLEGIRVRSTDNEHFSTDGGLYLRPILLPPLVKLGEKRALQRAE